MEGLLGGAGYQELHCAYGYSKFQSSRCVQMGLDEMKPIVDCDLKCTSQPAVSRVRGIGKSAAGAFQSFLW